MRTKAYFVGGAMLAIAGIGAAQTFHPDIPRAWDDKEVERLEVPLAQRNRSPRYLTAKEYYALKVRTIYRTYPVYTPGREPAGYLESLKQKEPEIVFDVSKLHTKDDWIRAGELIFDYSPSFRSVPPGGVGRFPPGLVPTTRESIIPYGVQYVVREKGTVEAGAEPPCSGCHQRVMPDGTAPMGAQSNFPFGPLGGRVPASARIVEQEWLFAGAPWVLKRDEFDKLVSAQEIVRRKV